MVATFEREEGEERERQLARHQIHIDGLAGIAVLKMTVKAALAAADEAGPAADVAANRTKSGATFSYVKNEAEAVSAVAQALESGEAITVFVPGMDHDEEENRRQAGAVADKTHSTVIAIANERPRGFAAQLAMAASGRVLGGGFFAGEATGRAVEWVADVGTCAAEKYGGVSTQAQRTTNAVLGLLEMGLAAQGRTARVVAHSEGAILASNAAHSVGGYATMSLTTIGGADDSSTRGLWGQGVIHIANAGDPISTSFGFGNPMGHLRENVINGTGDGHGFEKYLDDINGAVPQGGGTIRRNRLAPMGDPFRSR